METKTGSGRRDKDDFVFHAVRGGEGYLRLLDHFGEPIFRGGALSLT